MWSLTSSCSHAALVSRIAYRVSLHDGVHTHGSCAAAHGRPRVGCCAGAASHFVSFSRAPRLRSRIAMPPRRSARVAAAVTAATCAFEALPQNLALKIFALLPVDDLARCACVRRGWRATVADGCLWSRVDLSPSGGLTWSRERRMTRFFVALWRMLSATWCRWTCLPARIARRKRWCMR